MTVGGIFIAVISILITSTGITNNNFSLLNRAAENYKTNSPDCEGDVNQDKVINYADISIYKKETGTCNKNCGSDLDHNGSVDIVDYEIMMRWYGIKCQ